MEELQEWAGGKPQDLQPCFPLFLIIVISLRMETATPSGEVFF